MKTFESWFVPCAPFVTKVYSGTRDDAFGPGVTRQLFWINTHPAAKRKMAFGRMNCLGLLAPVLLMLGIGALPASALPLLASNQLAFVNLDHAPMGACSTITYGFKGDACGIGTETGLFPYWIPSGGGGGGVLIALSGSSGMQLMPFVASVSGISANAQAFPDASIQRTFAPCTDEFTIAGAGLAFSHYTPAWPMADFSNATLSEKKRYFLPANWLVFTITNTNSIPEDFYFGLPVAVTPKTFGGGAYQGFTLGEAALATQTGSCELLSGARLASVFNGLQQGAAFHLAVPAGQTRSLTVVFAYYRSAVVDSRTGAHYFYTSLFPSIDSVIDAAFAGLGDARLRCQQLAEAMSRAALNPFRQFLACTTLHTYMADTACVIDPQGIVHWWEIEGVFNFINTFDLTIDHAFYDAYMQPWALRNVLDGFSGALSGPGYSFDVPLVGPTGTQVSTHGFSFYHDMGRFPDSGTGPAYSGAMGDEELQTWILSAGLYWSRTADNAWLSNNLALLQTCLDSMLLRDHTNAASRDGITKNVNSGEITTFDDLDGSLRTPAFSGRLAVRNWACYLALNAIFNQVGDVADAATCHNMAGVTAQTIVDRWNTYQPTLGFIPALLDGSSQAATISMIEGLAYPAAMGLTNAIDRTGGPYASMLQALSNHVVAVLVPGKCLDPTTGAWMVTSGTSFTWQSKVFVAQYAAEAVLGITNNVEGAVDQVHASVQIQGAPFQGYSDDFYGTGPLQGGHHYPRGITSATWWLNATNSAYYPAATSAPVAPTVFSAVASDRQALLLWQGVPFATGYNLSRGNSSGGPYTTVTNGLVGGSFIDAGLNNGTTYYYVLTATNQIGEGVRSPEVVATPVPSVGTSLTASVSASKITVSWPATYVGWILQTNSVGLNNAGGWGDVTDSVTHSQMTLPVGGPNDSVQFLRLRHP
ncbi:MAG TPA: glycoside hydrolase family 52 protein [Verrucomicrobiae bacterium]|nr:glycoside hydrolase family 52 protein [Verrucomicrobiae bacterium]